MAQEKDDDEDEDVLAQVETIAELGFDGQILTMILEAGDVSRARKQPKGSIGIIPGRLSAWVASPSRLPHSHELVVNQSSW